MDKKYTFILKAVDSEIEKLVGELIGSVWDGLDKAEASKKLKYTAGPENTYTITSAKEKIDENILDKVVKDTSNILDKWNKRYTESEDLSIEEDWEDSDSEYNDLDNRGMDQIGEDIKDALDGFNIEVADILRGDKGRERIADVEYLEDILMNWMGYAGVKREDLGDEEVSKYIASAVDNAYGRR